MSLWAWIALACLVAYVTKLAGYLVPVRWLESPRTTRIAGTLTIGLLASLTAMNAFSAGTMLSVDARVGALMVAAIALLLRCPFLVVVIAGAVTSAALRYVGMA